MAHKALDNEHHVARWCSHQAVLRDENLGIEGVGPSAFELRPHLSEEYLSASWLEHFAGAIIDQLRQALALLRAHPKLGGRIGPRSVMLRLNVGEIKHAGEARNRILRIMHEPKIQWNPAYSAIRGLPVDNSDQELLDLLTQTPSLSIYEVSTL